jgi:hypothetical protein
MRSGIVLILLLGITLAFYSIPKEAYGLWTTGEGFECDYTNASHTEYKCCKTIKVMVVGVAVSLTACVNCSDLGGGHHGCGSPYITAKSFDTGEVVDPKVKDYAKALMAQGLVQLNHGTQQGGQVDPKVMNSAKTLIGQSLTVLTKGVPVDPKVTKDANILIDRILSIDKMTLQAGQNAKIPNTGLNSSTIITKNGTIDNSNHTKVPNRGALNGDRVTINPRK